MGLLCTHKTNSWFGAFVISGGWEGGTQSSWEGGGDWKRREERDGEDCAKDPLWTSDLSLDRPQLETFLFFKIPFAPSFACLPVPHPHTPLPLNSFLSPVCSSTLLWPFSTQQWGPQEVCIWIREKHKAALSLHPWFLWGLLILILLCNFSVRQLCFQLEKNLWP